MESKSPMCEATQTLIFTVFHSVAGPVTEVDLIGRWVRQEGPIACQGSIALEDLSCLIFDDRALEESGIHPAMELDCVAEHEVLEI